MRSSEERAPLWASGLSGCLVGDTRQDKPADGFTFGDMGIARKNERIDARRPIGFQAGDDLIRIAHDGCPGSASCPADSGPESLFDETVGVG